MPRSLSVGRLAAIPPGGRALRPHLSRRTRGAGRVLQVGHLPAGAAAASTVNDAVDTSPPLWNCVQIR